MNGTLYGIGVGPGDPELLTIKAINIIRRCQIIAVPEAGSSDRAAFNIVKEHLDGKDIIECSFVMERDMEKRKAARIAVAERIIDYLRRGLDVGFITLGDPTVYSTYMYIHELITERGFKAVIIPGIPSFTAAAAALGVPLCEDNETLTIIPALHIGGNGAISSPGSKVLMKSGKNLELVLETLKANGKEAKIACRVTMDGERLYSSISEYEQSPENGYFAIVLVRD